MTAKVALIFGYGPRVGAAVASAFAIRGYKVAVVSRSGNAEAANDYLSIKADLSDARNVEGVYAQVKVALGLPSVVVYNGMQVASWSLGQQAQADVSYLP